MHETHALSVAGKSLSVSLTSIENLFITRPSGVRSKKAIGARKILRSISLCK